MSKGILTASILVLTLAVQGGVAHAQFGYPVGYGNYGWGGWGGGGGTVGGDMARGLGVYAAGAGQYNQQTAVANSINADTVMRWNEYMYQSQLTAGRNERTLRARRQARVNETEESITKRLQENPTSRDIESGDALNSAAEQINNPRVYAKALSAAKVKVGGDVIRDIPFAYAAAAISVSIHQITQGKPPEALLAPAFAEERAEIREDAAKIRKSLDEGEKPDPAAVEKALAIIESAEAKVDQVYKKNTPNHTASMKYLKSVHGLLAMLETPALDVILSGVEKRPDATLAELLHFMNAFNLRFGPAKNSRQRTVYAELYPKLDALRDEIAPALATTAPSKMTGDEAGEFFSGMQVNDIKKKTPKPPAPGTQK